MPTQVPVIGTDAGALWWELRPTAWGRRCLGGGSPRRVLSGCGGTASRGGNSVREGPEAADEPRAPVQVVPGSQAHVASGLTGGEGPARCPCR